MAESAVVDAPETENAATDEAAEAGTKAKGGKAEQVNLSSRAKTGGSYRSGFCGGTVVNNVYITNGERLHKLCSTVGGMCTCACHQGVEVWDGSEQMFADARAGKRVTPNPNAAKGSAKGTKRSVARRGKKT